LWLPPALGGKRDSCPVDPSKFGGGGDVLGILAVGHAPASASNVRRRLVADLRRWNLADDIVDDAALLVSELVANAVRHAQPLPGGTVRVEWMLTPGRLMLRVSDGGGPESPHVREAGPLDVRGHGLAIVEALAAEWGVELTKDGLAQVSTVWAALPITPAGTPVAH